MYQPAKWAVGEDGAVVVTPIDWRGSGDPFGMANTTGLIYREARASEIRRGETVRFIPLGAPQ
jgi:molybdopterin biosynthesis enzyme